MVVDTVWEEMEILEKVFPTPVTELDLGDVFAEVKDSIEIEVDLPDSIQIDSGGLLLPGIVFENPLILFNTTRDSLIIKEFPFGETFRSSQRPNITDRYDGKINEVTISRKYERIFYSADIIIAVSTANGGYFHLNGKFRGSRMGQISSKITIH